MPHMICPKTRAPCRHCSNEVRRTTQRVGVIKTHLLERREIRIKLGAFCNNDGKHFVSELKECPIPGALAAPLLPFEIDELTWMRMKSGDA